GQAVHDGHADVHEHHVGTTCAHRSDRLATVGCLGHDLEIGLRVHEHADAGTEQRLVVDERDTDHADPPVVAATPSGMVARTMNAPPSSATSSLPPTSCARSRMPMSPCPRGSPPPRTVAAGWGEASVAVVCAGSTRARPRTGLDA